MLLKSMLINASKKLMTLSFSICNVDVNIPYSLLCQVSFTRSPYSRLSKNKQTESENRGCNRYVSVPRTISRRLHISSNNEIRV